MALLDLIEDKEEKVMDAIEFGWMDDTALIDFARNHEFVGDLDNEAKHDLIRELALRLDDLLTELDTEAGGYV